MFSHFHFNFPPPPLIVLSAGGTNNTQFLRLLHAPITYAPFLRLPVAYMSLDTGAAGTKHQNHLKLGEITVEIEIGIEIASCTQDCRKYPDFLLFSIRHCATRTGPAQDLGRLQYEPSVLCFLCRKSCRNQKARW